MRVVFLGTGEFAVPSLAALFDAGHDVAALVTQPDRGKGRGRRLAAPPTKLLAQARGIPVLQPSRIRDPSVVPELAALRADVQIVVAYGQILPRPVLDLAPRGTINVHASLLPRYRGAAPVAWAILRGETRTGVTTMLLDEGMDTGPTLLSRATDIGPDETAGELEARLAPIGAALLIETLDAVARNSLAPVAQDPALATRAPTLRKEDGRLDWNRPADELARRVRGLQPWPIAFAQLADGRQLQVLRARLEPVPAPPGVPPGTLLGVDAEGLRVACGQAGVLRLVEVRPENRRAMPAAAFAAGARLAPGDRLR